MKAAVLYGPKDIRLCEVNKPEPGPDDVVIKVRAAALCGSDIRVWQSGLPEGKPLILGHEMAGIISEVGTDVKGYKVGAKVSVAPNMGCGICELCVKGYMQLCPEYKSPGINLDGAFAEYVRIPADAVRQGNICLLSDKISFEDAAIVEAFSCVFNGLEACRITPGDSVLIIGAGPIGIMHAVLAKMSGASIVVINDLSEKRLEMVKQIDEGFYTYHGDDLKGYIMGLTNGRGLDVCVTACSSPQAQADSLTLMAVGGRVNFFGGLKKGMENVTLNTNLIHYRQLLVTGTSRSSLTQYRKCLSLVESGLLKISNLITHRYPLDKIEDAFLSFAGLNGIKTAIIF